MFGEVLVFIAITGTDASPGRVDSINAQTSRSCFGPIVQQVLFLLLPVPQGSSDNILEETGSSKCEPCVPFWKSIFDFVLCPASH